ncbi:MAG: hypothetical protein ACYDD1_04825 [Caulobacteraceae bacterium]
MNWLSRLFGKPKTDRPDDVVPPSPPATPELVAPDLVAPEPAALGPVAPEPVAPEPVARATAPEVSPQVEPHPEPAKPAEPPAPAEADDAAVLLDEDDDEPEAGDDAADPTIGRYAPLDETTLDDNALQALRAEAERLALSGSHKVGPADPAGPGSLVEALMRLEGEGRVVSRVCDDADQGFYILYEPVRP